MQVWELIILCTETCKLETSSVVVPLYFFQFNPYITPVKYLVFQFASVQVNFLMAVCFLDNTYLQLQRSITLVFLDFKLNISLKRSHKFQSLKTWGVASRTLYQSSVIYLVNYHEPVYTWGSKINIENHLFVIQRNFEHKLNNIKR